eukprot:GHVO01005901.1.p1 GENE.GHVO01005901.1~~GHVO01005901.1.p1  ORF type:complete len:225 (-),score=24.00 GHVO01005901.1:322-948(-)
MRPYFEKSSHPILYASTYDTDRYVSDDVVDRSQRIVKGFVAQSELLYTRMEWLVSSILDARESAIIEGVHLTSDLISRISNVCRRKEREHGNMVICVPLIIRVSSTKQHIQRFAPRSINFTTDPKSNKYVRHIDAIRAIQRYICTQGLLNGTLIVENDILSRALHSIQLHVLREILARRDSMKGDKKEPHSSGLTPPLNRRVSRVKSL